MKPCLAAAADLPPQGVLHGGVVACKGEVSLRHAASCHALQAKRALCRLGKRVQASRTT